MLREKPGIHWSGAGVWTGLSLEKIKGKCRVAESTDPSSLEGGGESSILSVYQRLRSDLTRADKSLCGETIAGTKGLVNLGEKKGKKGDSPMTAR